MTFVRDDRSAKYRISVDGGCAMPSPIALFAERSHRPAATPQESRGRSRPNNSPPVDTVPPAPDGKKPVSAAPEFPEPVSVEGASSEEAATVLPDDQ